MNNQIVIYDTTLRDGAQSVGVSYSVQDKLRIASVLDDLGIQYVEGGWPGSNPKDMAFFTAAKQTPLRQAKLCVFCSTHSLNFKPEKDPALLKMIKTEVPVATVFGKSWDFHVTTALGIEPCENLALIAETIHFLKKYFPEVVFDAEHFFDGYQANPTYARAVLQTAQDAGCDWLVLCDTNGGTQLEAMQAICQKMAQKFTIPLGIHAHNDSELAVANSLIAVEHGFRMVQGTINGLGERCGNANLCSLIPNLTLKKGVATIQLEQIEKLYYVSHVVSELSNLKPPDNLPYVGRNAFTHKGGIHVSAVRKNSSTYEHIDPAMVGNQRFFTVSELSGKSTMLEKAKKLNLMVDSESLEVQRILQRVKDLEAEGYYFEGAEASFELLCRQMLGQAKKYFTLHGYRVMIWKNSANGVYAEATVKADVPDEIASKLGFTESIEHTSADAGGPVEALDKALRKVLEKFYPQLKTIKLIDYKVRILNAESGTKAITRVLIQSADDHETWSTVGVSDNIIDASWQALTDSLIYKLMKDDERSAPSKGEIKWTDELKSLTPRSGTANSLPERP